METLEKHDHEIDTTAPSAGNTKSHSRPPARVGLLNTYSTRNIGDAAIMAALGELAEGDSVAACVREERPLNVPGVGLVDDIHASDRFISVGGDIFNNARPYLLTRRFLANLKALSDHSDRTILFGQTVPSSCRFLGLSLFASVNAGVIFHQLAGAKVHH